MSGINWALEENGAQIAEVSHEAAHVVSTASHLLQLREDQLWVTGDAPQHVTVYLSASHPPLQYAGWHVWQDYLTNPRMVEIASGASPDTMSVLLVCQALPGAGTQVWKLPRAIPQEHRYVRYKIMDTFGPGPTYMNKIVLLENDPGSHYGAPSQLVERAAASMDDFLRGESVSPRPSAATVLPHMSSPASALRPAGAAGSLDRSPLPRRAPPTSLLPGAATASTPTPRGARSADVEVLIGSGLSASAHRGDCTNGSAVGRSPGETRSCSRMSQLLRDLDDDIKMLKPIKIVSPGKNLLLHMPQEPPAKSLGSESEADAFAAQQRGDNREGNADGKGDDNGEDKPTARHHNRRHHCRSSSRRRNRDDRGRRSRNKGSAQPEGSQTPQPTPMSTSPMTLGGWAPQAVSSSAVELCSLHSARLGALEQAVAALNEAVQYQRDDLTMVRRVVLQQAMERRREAEQRYEETRKMSAAAAAPPPVVDADAKLLALQAAVPDQRLTHRSIMVDFPEDVLRAYVESVLDHKLQKHMKKVEARLLQRLDKQLHDLINFLSASIETRLARLTLSTATTQGQVAMPYQPCYAGRWTPTQAGGPPTGSPSGVHSMPRGSADTVGRKVDLSDIGSSPSSPKGHYYHTPLTRTDTSARGPASGTAAAAAPAAFPASYVAMRNLPHACRAVTGAPSVFITKRNFS
ncbi:hypothetical protein, conserved [Leishmania lindenbergi]|uniref:Uncharacterized protein n=1 Tax=Leishmania lindenbergi TaxID=651832 RepID=A0AAW3ABG4_9TRYP